MLVKDKIPYILFADFETSYIKHYDIYLSKRLRKIVFDNADKERYVWLINIQSLDGKINKTFADGKDTLKNFIDYIIKLNEEKIVKCKNVDVQIYFHNLSYDWIYIVYYICKYFNGVKKEANKIYYTQSKDEIAVYQGMLYYAGETKENDYYKKSKDKNAKKYQKYDQNGNEIKKYRKVKAIRFLDTYKLFPTSVKELGKSLGYKKLDENKEIVNKVCTYDYKATKEDIEYCERDVTIIRKAFIKSPEYGKNKLTLAGNSLQQFKDISFPMTIKGRIYNKFEELFPSGNYKIYSHLGTKDDKRINEVTNLNTVNSIIRDGYTGGVTQVNINYIGKYIINKNYKEKDELIHELKQENKPYILSDNPEIILDVNSLYPHIMKSAKIPYGFPYVIDFPDERHLKELAHSDNFFVIVEINQLVGELKNNHFPTIPASRKEKLYTSSLYLKDLDNINLIVNYEEFEIHKKNYNIFDYRITGAYVFNAIKGTVFEKYINKHGEDKENASKVINHYKKEELTLDGIYYDNTFKKLIAKLFMNTLYGKFGMNPDRIKKIDFFDTQEDKWISQKEMKYIIDDNGEKMVLEDMKHFVFPALASAITSYARLLLFNVINRIPYKYFLYCDTDSIHFLDNDVYGIKEMKRDGLIDDNILGKWKLEDKSLCSIYLAPKKYAFMDKDDNLIIKCAGLPDDAKNTITFIENFYYGYSATSKLQKKLIKGGYDLVPAKFVIMKPEEKSFKWFNKDDNDYLTFFI